MISTLLVPNLSSLALRYGHHIKQAILVHEDGIAVSPLEVRGMPLERARALVPHARVMQREYALESATWDAIVEQVFSMTPLLADEGTRIVLQSAPIAQLRTLVAKAEAQCGMAQTSTLALLAALTASSGGIVTVHKEDEQRFLDKLPIATLLLIPELQLEERTTDKLVLFGINTVGKLKLLSKQQLGAQFSVQGMRLFQFTTALLPHCPTANTAPLPHCLTAYKPLPDFLYRLRFTDGTNEPAFIEKALTYCVTKTHVASANAWNTSRVEVCLLNRADAPLKKNSRLLQRATNDVRVLITQAVAMLKEMVAHDVVAWGVRFRMASLTRPEAEQTQMFAKRLPVDRIRQHIARRFPSALKQITIVNPWAYDADRFAIISPWKPPA